MPVPSQILSMPIAHRGLHDLDHGAPENSMRAFELALQAGYPIELDVRILSDGRVAVFHDDTLERMTGIRGALGQQSAKSLSCLRLLGTTERIPLLQELLEMIDGRVALLIELKTGQNKVGRLEEGVLECLELYPGPFAIQSFNPFSMAWFRENAPHFPRGQLSSSFEDTDLAWWKRFLLRHLLLNGVSRPDFVAYDIRALPAGAVTLQKRLGLPVLGWTTTKPEEHEEALRWCDNVIFESYDPSLFQPGKVD